MGSMHELAADLSDVGFRESIAVPLSVSARCACRSMSLPASLSGPPERKNSR